MPTLHGQANYVYKFDFKAHETIFFVYNVDCLTTFKEWLKVPFGEAWERMSKKQKAHEWNSEMHRRAVIGKKQFANPYN